ncbi:MAG: tRNA (guanine(10)-N(2))-dimethyltransferase [Candidatus Nezhaarchaeota archaeon]|nr:tRNA (guanine(10)-N(2))-dimethyltransferase [Candidatus Nezhaarchaeota archaeon]
MSQLDLTRLKRVSEGKVVVLVPDEAEPTRSVFYNPAMEISRDIAVCCIRAYQAIEGIKQLSIAEPLTASGVRGIRYAKEVRGVREVVLGDVNPLAVKLAVMNVELNGLGDVATVRHEEANRLLASRSSPSLKFDVIDIDPFGSPAPFIEASIRALRDRGLLMLTATDTPPLCGIYPSVAERRYGVRSLKVEYCHEQALRILLAHVALSALKLDASIQPLLSYALRHHYRVCVKIRAGATEAAHCLKNLGTLLHCFECGHREMLASRGVQYERCPICGAKAHSASPIWRAQLLDSNFVSKVLDEVVQSDFKHRGFEEAFLRRLTEEAGAPPLYYTLDEVCRKLRRPQPKISEALSVLRKWGFEACRTHFHPKGVKTNALVTDLYAVVRMLTKHCASHKSS